MAEPGSHRQHDALQRRTVCGHNSDGAFVSKQFWYEQAVETVWWDLDLLYQAMRKSCNRTQKRCHWLTEFNRRVAMDMPIINRDLPFQFWESNADDPVPPEYLNRNIASSLAVYTYLATSVDRSKAQNDWEFCLSSLVKPVMCMCRSIETVTDGTVEVGTERIVIDRLGQVVGLNQCLSQGGGLHLSITELLKREWGVQHSAGNLASPLNRDTHSLADILQFILTFARRRRAERKPISKPCFQFLVIWRRALMAWFSKLADKFVLTTYLINAVSQERPAPALHYERPNKRKYTVVSPEAKWSILEKARTNRASPTTVLAVQSDSPHLGCNEQAADTWKQKEQAMYWDICGFALIGSNVHHFCLVSDPGHHNYKECLVSLLWCWELNQGMHCHWQHLVPGKILTPLDATMDEELARYAARQKLERVASFRQLQGYSNQLRAMTRYSRPRRVTLQSFALPQNFHIRPVTQNEGRKTVRGEHQDVSYIVHKETGVRTAILPAEPIKVLLLVLGLDQGSIGSAGGAFLLFYLRYMVQINFDKIHRLIRDIKSAENGCCQKIWTKTKLWSAYLYSLRKKAFWHWGKCYTDGALHGGV